MQIFLSELPTGLIPLYQMMIESIKPAHHQQAFDLFQVVRSSVLPLSPLAISYLDDESMQPPEGELTIITWPEIVRRNVGVSKRLRARSMGLIEIAFVNARGNYNTASWGVELDITHSSRPTKVQFLHLIVREFMASQYMQAWLKKCSSANLSNSNCHLLSPTNCATGLLDVYDHASNPSHQRFSQACIHGSIFLIMSHIILADRMLGRSQLPFLESLDRYLLRLGFRGVLRTTEGGNSVSWEHRLGDTGRPADMSIGWNHSIGIVTLCYTWSQQAWPSLSSNS